MELKHKIANTLIKAFRAEYVCLEDEGRITGFVVSPRFRGITAMDRQDKIEEALDKASLSPAERRRVLMVAALTPEEYAAAGARIRIHKIKEMAGGAVEVSLHGGPIDARYVREVLDNQTGIQTSDPKPVAGAIGQLMYLRAKGTQITPLTKQKAVRILKKDPYIEVMARA